MKSAARTAVIAVLACVLAGCGASAGLGPPDTLTVPPSPSSASPGQPPLHHVHDPGTVTGTLAGPCRATGTAPYQLPDPACTPGAIDPAVTAAVLCAPGYTTRTYRPPAAATTRFKYDVAYPAYGLPRTVSTELDHLVSLELGGANDASNLWPEPPPTPNPKDEEEGDLHAWVCSASGAVAQDRLTRAQLAIASDWVTAARVLGVTSLAILPVTPAARQESAMRYLVTGGAGFIGSALVRRLHADDHEVVVLDDFSRGRPDRVAGLAQVMTGDVRDPGTVRAAMQGCQAVIHAAYMQGTQTFYSEPRAVLDVALRGILNVLDACRETGCRQLLLVSSSEAYETPPAYPTPEGVPLVVPDLMNPRYSYGGGKIASELAALHMGVAPGILDRLIIARPHNVYGPDMGTRHVIPEFCERMGQLAAWQADDPIGFPIQGSGEETRSFCYISDFTGQMMTLLRSAPRGAQVYHLGTMDERTIADVAHAVARCYGRRIKIEPGILPEGSPSRRLPDIAKLLALGYAGPYVSFADGVAETARWYRAHA